MSIKMSVEKKLHITIYEKINTDVRLNDLVEQYLPEFFFKLRGQNCSINELIEIQTFIDLQHNIEINNIHIGLRLSGGLAQFCKYSNVAIKDAESMLRDEAVSDLISLLAATLELPKEWFKTGRVFYSEKQICRLRSSNLSALLPCINNHMAFMADLKEKLNPVHDAYPKVLKGERCAHGSRICRILENTLTLSRGNLDLSQRKFNQVLANL